MTDQRDQPPRPEEQPADASDQRPDAGAQSPQEADARLLENLSPFLNQRGPAPHDPPSASDTASWRYDDHGMPLRPRRRGRILLRIVAPIAFLILVVALVTVVLESGVMKKGSSSSPSASPTSTAAGFVLYKVKKGDTLSGIANKKHTNTTAILDLNPGLNENSLSVGEKIRVPKPSPTP
jgi:nucleoid-associated protein YgaU